MTEWNMPKQPPNIWGQPTAPAAPAPNVWGVQPTIPQATPQTAAPGQELTPDEKKTFESFRYDEKKLVEAWRLADDSLQIAKMREMSLRKLVFKVKFTNPHTGTNNVELPNGDTLKAVVKYTYTLDADNEKVEAALNSIENSGNEGKFIAERLVTWKPDLVKKEYDALIEDAKTSKLKEQMLFSINSVITKKPATPSLEVKDKPKEKA